MRSNSNTIPVPRYESRDAISVFTNFQKKSLSNLKRWCRIQVRHTFRMNEIVYLAYPWKKARWQEAAKSWKSLLTTLELTHYAEKLLLRRKLHEFCFWFCPKILDSNLQKLSYSKVNKHKNSQQFAKLKQHDVLLTAKKVVSWAWKSDFNGDDKCNRNSFCFVRQVRLICRKTNQGDNPIHLQASIHKTPDLPSQFSYYANDYAVHEDASYDTQLELKPFINAPLKKFLINFLTTKLHTYHSLWLEA